MAMEKRKKTAAESGVLILIIAAILVAVNALSRARRVHADRT